MNITESEWQIMKVIWTINRATSREIITLISKKMDWSESTIKTLLSRLVNKKYLKIKKSGRNNIYEPTISEVDAMQNSMKDMFASLCSMKVGSSLTEVIKEIELSKNDIDNLQRVLELKKKDAPEVVQCNCLSGCNLCKTN